VTVSTRPTRLLAAAVAAAAVLLTACADTGSGAGTADISKGTAAASLRLGFFANVTHAPALVAVANGYLAKDLGSTTLKTQVFNAGPAAIEALNAGAIDAAYLGPNPAINGFVKSHGSDLRIVSGAVSGGAQLVVKPSITSAAQLKGTNLATPQLGGTQDVALRSWLSKQGLRTSLGGGGDVTITPTENAQTLQLFKAGKLDGAWLPEPWSSRLVLEAGAKVLVDEKSLWPDGKFLTTNIVVATKFLEQHPQTVRALLQANLEAVDWIGAHPADAQKVVNARIDALSGKPLKPAVIARSFTEIQAGVDPLASTLKTVQDNGVRAGTTTKAALAGIYDLRLLNALLAERGRPPVSAAGLGEE